MSTDAPNTPTPKLIYERVLVAMATANPDDLVKLSAALKNLHDIIHGTKSGSVSVLEQLLQHLEGGDEAAAEQPTEPPDHLKTTDE